MIWLIGLTLVYRLWSAGTIDLILGEAYYVSSARMLHLGYFDQPPLSLWISWAMQALFHTDNAFVMRLPYVLIFVPVTWLVYRIGARVRSEWAGFLAAFLLNISLLFTISIGTWVQPDAPLMLFWLLAALLLISLFFDELTPRQQLVRWLWAGIWLGLGFMSKYHAVFVPLAALLFMLTNARRAGISSGPVPISASWWRW